MRRESRSRLGLAAWGVGTAVFLIAAVPVAGQTGAEASEELRLMYEADQADRTRTSPPTEEEWAEISKRDRERRDRVHELLRADRVDTAEDMYHAAMVLQHGEGSEDILLAHVLSTAAAFQGHEGGRWLSAAALDRYLHRSGSPQLLGTQYVKAASDDPYRMDPDAPWSQGAYNDWLPDRIRAAYGVPAKAEQEERVKRMNGGS